MNLLNINLFLTKMDENSYCWRLQNICCYCGETGHNNLTYQCQYYIEDRVDNMEYLIEMELCYGPHWYVNIGQPHCSYDIVQYLQEEHDRYIDIYTKSEEERKKIEEAKYITIEEISNKLFLNKTELYWFY